VLPEVYHNRLSRLGFKTDNLILAIILQKKLRGCLIMMRQPFRFQAADV